MFHVDADENLMVQNAAENQKWSNENRGSDFKNPK